MIEDNFIGIGHNPNGVDLPLGLGMQLAQEPKAMEAFGHMTPEQKAEMVEYIRQSTTGDDAKQRIMDSVNRLRDGYTPGMFGNGF